LQLPPNGSPQTIVFGDVKKLQQFEGYHPVKQFSIGTPIVGYV